MTLLVLFVFVLFLVSCTTEQEPVPASTTSPSLAEVLSSQVPATSTIQSTIALSITPKPTDVLEQEVTLRVSAQSINLRNGPGIVYGVVGYLFADDKVRVLARDMEGAWYNVLTKDNESGWVAASATELLNDEDVLDSIELAVTIPVPPTHTPVLTPQP